MSVSALLTIFCHSLRTFKSHQNGLCLVYMGLWLTSCAPPHLLCAFDAALMHSNILSDAEWRAAPRVLLKHAAAWWNYKHCLKWMQSAPAVQSVNPGVILVKYLILGLKAALSDLLIGCPPLTEGVNSRWLGLMCARYDYIKDMHFKKPELLAQRDYLLKCWPNFF